MAQTNCQSQYFKLVDGELLCDICGEPASKHNVKTKQGGISTPRKPNVKSQAPEHKGK